MHNAHSTERVPIFSTLPDSSEMQKALDLGVYL